MQTAANALNIDVLDRYVSVSYTHLDVYKRQDRAYIMPGVWGFLNKRKMEPASPTKQAIGLLLLSDRKSVV